MIKMMIPFLASLTSLLCKIKTIFTMKGKFTLIIEKLSHSDIILQYPLQKMSEDRKLVTFSIIGIFIYSFPAQIFTIFTVFDPINCFLSMLNIYNNFSTFCMEMQFCLLAILVIRRLRALHKHIGNLFTEKNMYGYLGKTQKTVENLKQAHKYLNDCCELIIDYFNVPILISLMCTTIDSFMNIYFAIFGGFIDAGTKRSTHYEITAYCIWAVYYFSRFCIICIAADQMMSEVKKNIRLDIFLVVFQ